MATAHIDRAERAAQRGPSVDPDGYLSLDTSWSSPTAGESFDIPIDIARKIRERVNTSALFAS